MTVRTRWWLLAWAALMATSPAFGAVQCDQPEPSLAGIEAKGWGADARNTRYHPQSKLQTANVDWG